MDWQVVVLDFCLMGVWAWLGVTYISNGRSMRGTCLLLAALGISTLAIGDIGTALGHSGADYWYFQRWFRGLPWRYTTTAAFIVQIILIKVKSF